MPTRRDRKLKSTVSVSPSTTCAVRYSTREGDVGQRFLGHKHRRIDRRVPTIATSARVRNQSAIGSKRSVRYSWRSKFESQCPAFRPGRNAPVHTARILFLPVPPRVVPVCFLEGRRCSCIAKYLSRNKVGTGTDGIKYDLK